MAGERANRLIVAHLKQFVLDKIVLRRLFDRRGFEIASLQLAR